MSAKPEAPRTTLAALLLGHQVFALRYGIEPEVLCEHAEVPIDALTHPYQPVPFAWLLRFWRSLVALLPEVDVGIEVGLFWTLDRLGAIGELARHHSSALAMLRTGERAMRLFELARIHRPARIEETADTVTIAIPQPTWEDVTERMEALVFFLVGQLRAYPPAGGPLMAAHFGYRRDTLRDRYHAFFDCELHFDCEETRLVFARAPLQAPNPHASEASFAYYAAYLERVLVGNLTPTFLGQVERAIAKLLEGGGLSQGEVARALGLSLRSLQRKLDQANTSFRELVAAQRSARAIRLLTTTDRSIGQVAMATGYSDLPSFLRAFRRWTGRTPGEFRRPAAE